MRSYRALATILTFQDHDVSEAVGELACVPCRDEFLRRTDDEATRAVLYWIMENQSPPLLPELQRVLGDDCHDTNLAAGPGSAAAYAQDAKATCSALQSAYERCGFAAEDESAPGCHVVSYVSQHLGFIAQCLESDQQESMTTEEREVLEHSLCVWAPLFARALAGATAHPALVFAGVKLQSLLADQPL